MKEHLDKQLRKIDNYFLYKHDFILISHFTEDAKNIAPI